MALRKLSCTAAAALRSAAYSSPRSLLRCPTTAGLLVAAALRSAAYSSPRSLLRCPTTAGLLVPSIDSTKSRFSAKYPFNVDDIIFGKLSYSTAAKSSPPQDMTCWKQLIRKVQLSARTMKDAVLSTSGCQNVIEQGKCKALNYYGNDLTELARRGKLNPILGRKDEIDRCIQILSCETKSNPIILADIGKARTEIVEGLAHEMIYGDVSETLVNRKLISLDTSSLLASTKSREHFKQRLEASLKEITASDDQIILFIDEIHKIVGTGGHDGEVDVGNLFISMLGRGDLRIVGATTFCQYKMYIQGLDLEHRFQKVLCDNLRTTWFMTQCFGFIVALLAS